MLSLCSLTSSNQIGIRFFLSILTLTHLSHLSTQIYCMNWCSSATLCPNHMLLMSLTPNFLDPWSSWHPAKIVKNISLLPYQNIFAMTISFVFPHSDYVRKDWMWPHLQGYYYSLMLLSLPTLSIFVNIWKYWNFRIHLFISIKWYLNLYLQSLFDYALTIFQWVSACCRYGLVV